MKGLTTFLLLFCFHAGYGITSSKPDLNTNIPNDKVILFTDRMVYITGDDVYFSAKVFNSSGELSKVLYIEIITPEGQKITGGKFPVENKFSSGSISLPTDMLTGNYYIKGYTKWMRNFSVSDYFFSPIKIFNPTRHDLLQSTVIAKETDSSQFVGFEKNIPNLILIGSNRLGRRQKVSFSLNQSQVQTEFDFINISIVPAVSVSKILGVKSIENNESTPLFQHNSDAKGLSLTGKISNRDTGSPSEYIQVNLSILGQNPDFIATRTDSLGRFGFNMPSLWGKNEIYIGVEEKINSEIKIDNDFCTRKVTLPFLPLTITDDERVTVNNMARNKEIITHFTKNSVDTFQIGFQKIPFYGIPDNTFEFDKYVNLLSVEEYFHELIPNASVRKREGKSVFIINGNYPEMKVYDPLVLIDFIAVDRVDRILAANPKLLSRIDIVTKPYYKGDMVFGGIISFFSSKGDLAGIDLPSSDMFLEFDFFSKNSNDQPKTNSVPSNIPDTRTTLLWRNICEDNELTSSFELFTPDTPGEYTICLRGVTKTGQVVFSSTNLVVY